MLANFTVAFDYRRGEIGWRFVGGYRQPPFPRSGLRLLKDRRNDARVVAVIDGSPAAEAGIRERDRLVAIDGVSTADLSGSDIADVFRRDAGTKVRLAIARDDACFDVTLVLRDLVH